MEDYLKQVQLKKKKNGFKECSISDCEHLKCNLGQNQEGCLFCPVDGKAKKAKKVAKFIDNIPIIGTGGNRMTDYLAFSSIALFGLFFITGKEIVTQTPNCEECTQTIEIGKNVWLGYYMVLFALWMMVAPKNLKDYVSRQRDKILNPIKEFVMNKFKRKKDNQYGFTTLELLISLLCIVTLLLLVLGGMIYLVISIT